MTIGLAPGGGGVLRMVRPGVYLHWCQACRCGHTFDVHEVSQDGKVIGYDGDPIRPSVGQPLRHEKDGAVCEYILKAGVQLFLESCTHALRGQSLPLIEFPR
jgi:hypothetical protein